METAVETVVAVFWLQEPELAGTASLYTPSRRNWAVRECARSFGYSHIRNGEGKDEREHSSPRWGVGCRITPGHPAHSLKRARGTFPSSFRAKISRPQSMSKSAE